MNLYPIIEPDSVHREMRFFLTGDVVFFRHKCLVIRGINKDEVPESNDYYVAIRPVYSEDDLGTGSGCAALVRANDTRLLHATGSSMVLESPDYEQ